MTTYEREQQHKEQRAKRQANIDDITARLNEANSIYPLVEDFSERIEVKREIDRLNKMLDEERTALATIGSDDVDFESVAGNMV